MKTATTQTPSITQQQTAGTSSAIVPQQQGTISQIPSAFVRLRQQQQTLLVANECARCGKPIISPTAVFCAACGLPLGGCPCPSCQQLLVYSRHHLKKNSEVFHCYYCGIELEWRQKRGGPVDLEIY